MAKRPSAAKTMISSAEVPRLVARLIGVERYKGVLRAEGWVSGPIAEARVTAHVAGDPAAATMVALTRSSPARWSG